MESLENSNCHSLSDSFSLYERYLRSFNVVNNFVEEDRLHDISEQVSSVHEDYESSSSSRGNIDLSAAIQTNNLDKPSESAELKYNLLNTTTCENIVDKRVFSEFQSLKGDSTCTSRPVSPLDSSSNTTENCLRGNKFEHADIPVSSEDSKPERFKQPIFITSTMENSNNAVDSVPMFRDVRPSESVFKLPIRELSFNGTLKHVQKLKPIVDPLSALSSNTSLVNLCEKSITESIESDNLRNYNSASASDNKSHISSSISDEHSSSDKNFVERTTESTGDSQYEEFNVKRESALPNEYENSAKWNSEQSYSSLEASFDSGVRSPDIFSDEDEATPSVEEPFWNFIRDFESYDKRRVKKSESILQGVLPPPSVTVLKTDITTMLKKYYCFLPAFTGEPKSDSFETNSVTPTKKVSFVHIPTDINTDPEGSRASSNDNPKHSVSKEGSELDTSVNDKSVDLKMCTQTEAAESAWPDIIKCRYHDVYYNVTKYNEKLEALSQRFGERFVGAETDTSVCIHSGGLQSPSSASKRKALRLAQAKSPGRRLSHLARRRQTFCSAATINEKVQSSAPKMVLIDKNFFPHRKLINTSEKRSPRKVCLRRTPGKKTPGRKTPGKKTPAKTPKTHSGGSSRKKSMRRLLMDTDNITRTQPTLQSSKRALFISPEGRKEVPVPSCTSVPLQAMRSKRALFSSPVPAETKSADGSESDHFPKRKRNPFDDEPDPNRSKIAKSLSFGGDTINSSQSSFSLNRRASEIVMSKRVVELNDNHKQKLLWAVSVALRDHGWGMSSPGFRDKAQQLARLTRRLLALPPHAARLAAARASTSDTLLRLARLYVFPIIQGRTIEDCFEEEKLKVANEANSKVTGYISASAYQQLKAKQAAASTFTSQIKENTFKDMGVKELSRSNSKNILQDKLVNIDSNSNSSGMSFLDKNISLFKSHSMPSFEEAAKMRARRQISFDNVEFSKR